MQIDWLTVAAQIVNFLILVWLLQRFLYRPVTAAMRRREEKVEGRLAEARDARAEAEAEAERLRQRQEDLERQKADIIEQARAEAADLRARLEADLRDEMEESRAAWRRQLDEERAAFSRALQRRAGRQVLEIASGVVAEFADADLTDRVARTFAGQLETLEEGTRARLSQAAQRAEGAVIETGRPLDSATRGRVTRALHEALDTRLPVSYAQADDLVLGVRVTIGEQSLEWSSDSHLKRLDSALDEILDSTAPPGPSAARSPT